MVAMHRAGIIGRGNAYSSAKRGWFIDGDRKYFMRSSWEMNYACYLNFLIEHKEIRGWDYEAETFWFDAIKRGVRSYTPDFKVELMNGEYEYHEVKGWMDAKSATKLKRMAKYHPEIKMVLVDAEQYKAIMKHKKLYNIHD